METRMAFTTGSLLLRLALSVAMIFFFPTLSRTGGPKCVAGATYFDPTSAGIPLVWPQGLISYSTDQGDLGPILPNASAHTFVASAFSQWPPLLAAAVAATGRDQRAENETGTTVFGNGNGPISLPADIQPTATGTPV